jgi:hypothetical protein
MLPLRARFASTGVGIGVAAADFGKSVGGHKVQDTGGRRQKAESSVPRELRN